jgi:hypothetical protein
MNRFRHILLTALSGGVMLLGLTACDGLFSEEPKDKLSEETIWETPMLLDEYTLPWYRNMNSGFSIYMPTSTLLKGLSREYLPWFTDQITVSKSEWYSATYGDLLKSDLTELTRKGLTLWTSYYTQISSINNLLENQDKIASGTQKERLLGEAYFMRAYYYYLLLRRYGAVLLVDCTFNPIVDGKTFPRASYAEMIDFIAADADRAIALLPVAHDSYNLGRVTKGAAMMLKAKAYFWASSDFFQNKELDYLGFTDDRSAEMTAKAVSAYDDLFALNAYQLTPVSGTTQKDIAESYRQIFLTKNGVESIFEVQHADDGNYDTGFGHKLDRESAPPSAGGTTAAYTPTQNHVDEYGMRDGALYDAQNPYANRDYRFYANVLYDGAESRGATLNIHYTKVGSKETAGTDLTKYGSSETAAVTKTGYYMAKFINENTKIDADATYASSQNYIIWRYAEALLDYAELAFRQGKTSVALEKVNAIRQRAHMDLLTSLTWEQLVNERRVEMAFEETIYWDQIRWGTAYKTMRGETNPIKAMKIVYQEGKDPTYTISNMNKYPKRVRDFREYQYYLPIPWDDIRYHGIAQNPGWEEV